jgi:hypothetical protein
MGIAWQASVWRGVEGEEICRGSLFVLVSGPAQKKTA